MGQKLITKALKILENETQHLSSSKVMKEMLLSHAKEKFSLDDAVLADVVKIFKMHLQNSREAESQHTARTEKLVGEYDALIKKYKLKKNNLKNSFKQKLQEVEKIKHEEIKKEVEEIKHELTEKSEKNQFKQSKKFLLIRFLLLFSKRTVLQINERNINFFKNC